jgi:hypothetical protein
MDRRNFSKLATSGLTIVGINGLFNLLENKQVQPMEGIFLHQVYFWLKNPSSKEDHQKFIEGLGILKQCKSIQSYHIGKPAGTSRDVIDGSYTYSWFTIFKSAADQEAYQIDPFHDQFRKKYHHLWSKVVVYDSIDV